MEQLKQETTSASNVNDARKAPTQFINVEGGRIAYRSIGTGSPVILCNRFRGTLDTWDPAFLDALAQKNRVITFDYPGIGLSDGELPKSIRAVSGAVNSLAGALGIDVFNLIGWSYGGAVAQTFASRFGGMLNNLILIGANPPGKNDAPLEQAFLDAAFKPFNDLKDDEVLFFEPSVAASVEAARISRERIASRKEDLSGDVTPDKFANYFEGVAEFQQDEIGAREKLASVKFPILVLAGDHDPACPVQNWYPLVGEWKSAHLHVIGSSGHGLQHEFPEFSARLINLTINYSNR